MPVLALDMPPTGAGTVITPETFNPFICQGQHMPIGRQELIGTTLAEAPQHQLTDICQIEMMLWRHAENALLGMQGAVQLPALGAAPLSRRQSRRLLRGGWGGHHGVITIA